MIRDYYASFTNLSYFNCKQIINKLDEVVVILVERLMGRKWFAEEVS